MAGRVIIPTGHAFTPLVVVGCEVGACVVPTPGRSALYTFDHQFQGTACSQISIHGAGLLLEHNLEHLAGSGAPETALKAMKTLGEHPIEHHNWAARERLAVTDWLSDTPLGAPMPQAWVTAPDAVARFTDWLRHAVLRGCPAIERYTEALAISERLPDLPPTLAEWRVLICHPRRSPEYDFSPWSRTSDQPLPHTTRGPKLGKIWSQLVSSLSHWDSVPRLHFIWANSD